MNDQPNLPTPGGQPPAPTTPPTIISISPPSVLEALNRSSLESQIATAHRYPRSLHDFMNVARSLVREDRDTARSCYYVLKRKDADGQNKNIEGPSVRLAELMVHAWGHLRIDDAVVGETDREIIAQAIAVDLQANNAYRTEVRRRCTRSNGQKYGDDMMTVTANAARAIARRNVTFLVIPRIFTNKLVREAKATAAGTFKTIEESRKACLADFAKLGIDARRVCARVDKAGVEDLDVDDLAILFGVFTAITDKETTLEEEFPPEHIDTKTAEVVVGTGAKGARGLAEKLKGSAPADDAGAPKAPGNGELPLGDKEPKP